MNKDNHDINAKSIEKTPVLNIKDLLLGGREAIILHDGVSYRLRITSNNKLIMTK